MYKRVPSSSASTSSKTPCCSKVGIKRGPWTPEEDEILSDYVKREGEGRWRTLPKRAGLQRCGKSCRLRWMNYLHPSIKRGRIAPDEEDLIFRLHRLLGNRWSLIAGRIPGRTDNEIKNYWNTHMSKKLISQGLDPRTHKPLNTSPSPITAAVNINFEPTSSLPPQQPFPNVPAIDEASGSQHRPISIAEDVPRLINEREQLQNLPVTIETGNLKSSNLVSMDPHNVSHSSSNIGNFNSEDVLSSLLDNLMDDNYANPYHWSGIAIPPPLAPTVFPAMNFSSQGGLWDAELVKSALETLDDQPDYNNNNIRLIP